MININITPLIVNNKIHIDKDLPKILCPACKSIICVSATVSMKNTITGIYENLFNEYLGLNFEECKVTVSVNNKNIPNSLRLGGSLQVLFNTTKIVILDFGNVIELIDNNIIKNLDDAYTFLNKYSLFL